MSIKMTRMDVTNNGFRQAVISLTQQKFSIKVAYDIKKLTDALMKVQKQVGADYQKELIEKFAKKNPDGSFAHPKNEDGSEKTDEFDMDESQKAEFMAAQETFGSVEVTIDRPKLMINLLGQAQLSARELAFLDPLLTEIGLAEETHAQAQ